MPEWFKEVGIIALAVVIVAFAVVVLIGIGLAVYATIRSAVEELRKGKAFWVNDDDVWFVCSKCGQGQDYHYRYCPECGAKMEVQDGKAANVE